VTLNALRTVNPFLKKDNYVDFECGIIQAEISDGVLTAANTIATQSKRLSVVGSGVIDLSSEELEFAITPNPRKGLGLSASNFARIVKIGGTLQQPAVEADPAGFLKSGAKIGAALYTGGLSVLAEGLFNRIKATENVCEAVDRLVDERRLGGTASNTVTAPAANTEDR